MTARTCIHAVVRYSLQVNDSSQFDLFFVSSQASIKDEPRHRNWSKAYTFWSQSLTIWSISRSDLFVSSNPGVSTRTKRSPWTGWLNNLTARTSVVHGSRREPARLPIWLVRMSIIFKRDKNMKNIQHIAYIALSRSSGTHQPETVISSILEDMWKRPYAMIRSLPKSFAVFLISSDIKAIAEFQIYSGRWCRTWKFADVLETLKGVIALGTRLQTALQRLHDFSIQDLEPCGCQEDFPKWIFATSWGNPCCNV